MRVRRGVRRVGVGKWRERMGGVKGVLMFSW